MSFPRNFLFRKISIRALSASLCLASLSMSGFGQMRSVSKSIAVADTTAETTATTCSGGTIDTVGNSSSNGTAGNIRNFSGGGVSVHASAFGRRYSNGAGDKGWLGAFSPGLGVTDASEDGANDSHKVDNVGSTSTTRRNNYVMFEFSRPVIVDQVFLDSIGDDSDIDVWIGTRTDPYNNHLNLLSDAILSTLTSENSDSTVSNSSRSANINGSGQAGNVLIVAANFDGTNDSFKIGQIDFKCPDTTGSVTIIKKVNALGGATTSSQAFGFTSTNFGTPSSFSLVDQNVTGPDRRMRTVTSFGTGNTITVTENSITGWTLLDITCTGAVSPVPVVTFGARKVSIVPQAGRDIVCTFTNGQLGTTAAPASVTGQVLSAEGLPIIGATLTLTNASTGETRSARSNPFGYYTFSDIEVSNFYSLSVSHKRYVFAPDTQFFTLDSDLSGTDFIAIY